MNDCKTRRLCVSLHFVSSSFSHLSSAFQNSFFSRCEDQLERHERTGQRIQLEVTSAFLPLRPRVVTSGLKKTKEKDAAVDIHSSNQSKRKRINESKTSVQLLPRTCISVSFFLTCKHWLVTSKSPSLLFVFTSKRNVMIRVFAYVFLLPYWLIQIILKSTAMIRDLA